MHSSYPLVDSYFDNCPLVWLSEIIVSAHGHKAVAGQLADRRRVRTYERIV
jgi:hypothetical protein